MPALYLLLLDIKISNEFGSTGQMVANLFLTYFRALHFY